MTDLLGTTSLGHISTFQRPFGPRFLMDENASGGGEPGPSAPMPTVREAASGASDHMSVSQAARALQAARKRPDPAAAAPVAETPAEPADTETPAESADEPATAETELSDEGSAAPDESQATGETDGTQNPPAATPKPLPLPRSWTKEQTEHWNALPRTTQEFLTEQASKTSAEVRRVQNEAAENSKALTAKEQAAEQARTQYETKIKSVVEVLEKEQLREFPDIRTQADLDKLTGDLAKLSAEAVNLWTTDPLAAGQMQAKAGQIQAKLSAWGIHQQKLVAASNELQQAETRKSQETKTAWQKHIEAEGKLAAEKIPELADKVKGPALRQRAVEALVDDLGFTNDELNKLASGDEKISINDHRFQQLLYSHLRLAEITSAKKAVAAKPVPPVQRPGTPAPRGSVQTEQIKALTEKATKSGSIKDAVALLTARRAAQRR